MLEEINRYSVYSEFLG